MRSSDWSSDVCSSDLVDAMAKIVKAQVVRFETLYTNDIDCGPFISDTLKIDSTTNQLEALVEIYRIMRPGEPPTKDAAETLFKHPFLVRSEERSVGKECFSPCRLRGWRLNKKKK